MATNEQTSLWWKYESNKNYIYTEERKTKIPNSGKRGTSPTKARISETKVPAILHVYPSKSAALPNRPLHVELQLTG